MALFATFRALLLRVLMAIAPARKITPAEMNRADLPPHPGGKGLRFTERLRDALRPGWLKLRK